MNTQKYGTYALALAVVGLGSWVVNDTLDRDSGLALAAESNAPSFGGSAPPPIYLSIVPAAPQPQAEAKASKGQTRKAAGAGLARAELAGSSSPRPSQPAGVAGPATRSGNGSTTARADAGQVVYLIGPPGGSQPRGSTAAGGAKAGEHYQVLATNGSIVYIGANGQLMANTGPSGSSGVIALGVQNSTLESGASTPRSGTATASAGSGTQEAPVPHANGSFMGVLRPGSADGRSIAISGFEDHSVSVLGDDQIVTYDDSNVFIARNGQVNANTGDTDSSGLNAVDVTGSRVRAGNSGDGEASGEDEEEEEEEVTTPASDGPTSHSSDDEDADTDDEAEEDAGAALQSMVGAGAAVAVPGDRSSGNQAAGSTYATVSDEGASIATGTNSLVVGADGFDDVSIRSQGNRNIVTYDDSNVVIGGTGSVNAQIGDSDTGGAVVMGIHNSDVQAGCEGDLCYSN